MAEHDNLESWLKANKLSELLPILEENDVAELSDLTEFEDQSEIDEFVVELRISTILQSQLKTALLRLMCADNTSPNENEEIRKINEALCCYYESLGSNGYYKPNNKGKFKEFMDVNGFDQKDIEQQLGDNGTVDNCLFVDMDEDFPLVTDTQDVEQRNKEIFEILQHCYKYKMSPAHKNQSQTENTITYECYDDSDDCYQESFIDPLNTERLQAVWNSENAKTDIIKCIGSLRIEFTDKKKLTKTEVLLGTATVIDIDENDCCHVLTVAHNAYQLLRQCPGCNKKTICQKCVKCATTCKRVKPLQLIEATRITFFRRCIVKQQIDSTGEIKQFGDPISSYHINNYKIYKSLYQQHATAKSGYDLCIMSFQCNNVEDVDMYREICRNIQLISDDTFARKSKARLHIFGYPGSKGYVDKYTQRKMHQMYGMSSGVNGNKFKVAINDITKRKYVINDEIDTEQGMSGSSIWTFCNKRQQFLIYAVHAGGKQEDKSGVNYGTFLDKDHIEWIERMQFKLLLKPGFNIVPSKKREYILEQLKENEYAFTGGDGYRKGMVSIKTTIRDDYRKRTVSNDDEKKQNVEIKQEQRDPEKLFADDNHKIILICGKTGTGKTTLINSMMNYIYG
eukprot:447575_1